MKKNYWIPSGRVNESGILTFSMKDAATILKEMGEGRNNIMKYMREANILTSNNELTLEYDNSEYFTQEITTGYDPYCRLLFAPVRVTEKGIDFLRKIITDYRPWVLIDDLQEPGTASV